MSTGITSNTTNQLTDRHNQLTKAPTTKPYGALANYQPTGNRKRAKKAKQVRKARIAAELAAASIPETVTLEVEQAEASSTVSITGFPPTTIQDWQCPECAQCFSSKQAMRMHYVQKHGSTHIAQLYVAGTICRAFMKHFHTRSRAVRHLKKQQMPIRTSMGLPATLH